MNFAYFDRIARQHGPERWHPWDKGNCRHHRREERFLQPEKALT